MINDSDQCRERGGLSCNIVRSNMTPTIEVGNEVSVADTPVDNPGVFTC